MVSVRSTGIFRRANIWSKLCTGARSRRFATAAEELARNNVPDVALAEWMQRFVDYIAAKRGMANSLRILFDANSEVFPNTSGMVALALQRLVDAAVADGSVRSDIDINDISQALSGIYSAPDTPDWRDRSRRLLSRC